MEEAETLRSLRRYGFRRVRKLQKKNYY